MHFPASRVPTRIFHKFTFCTGLVVFPIFSHNLHVYPAYSASMDKKATRKIRIDDHRQALQNVAMEEEKLFDEAVLLAYATFYEPTDDHVLGVFERLVWNMQRGIGVDGAVTIH